MRGIKELLEQQWQKVLLPRNNGIVCEGKGKRKKADSIKLGMEQVEQGWGRLREGGFRLFSKER